MALLVLSATGLLFEISFDHGLSYSILFDIICLFACVLPTLFHLISSYFMLLSYVGQGQGTIRTPFEKSKATDSALFCAILCEALRVPCEEARFWERSIPGVRNAGPLRVWCGWVFHGAGSFPRRRCAMRWPKLAQLAEGWDVAMLTVTLLNLLNCLGLSKSHMCVTPIRTITQLCLMLYWDFIEQYLYDLCVFVWVGNSIDRVADVFFRTCLCTPGHPSLFQRGRAMSLKGLGKFQLVWSVDVLCQLPVPVLISWLNMSHICHTSNTEHLYMTCEDERETRWNDETSCQ